MIKQITIREQLGLKQEELAQLLQVTRSQLSLYEIGKRKLPLHATQKLASMLSFVQNKSRAIEHKSKNNQKELKILQQLLIKNQHQQLINEKKMLALQKKQKAVVATEKVVEHLMEQAKTKKEIKLIDQFALKKNRDNTDSIIQFEIKKEVLAFEEQAIKIRIEIALKT